MKCGNEHPDRPEAYRTLRILYLAQLSDSSYFHPLDHENISLMIEAGAVRGDEFARGEVVARHCAGLAPLGLGIVAQVLNHLIVLIQQSHARAEIRNHYIAVLEVSEVTRHI